MDEVVKSGVAQRTYLYGLRRISQTQVASGTTITTATTRTGTCVPDEHAARGERHLRLRCVREPGGNAREHAEVYRYQGEALDAETGLYYMRARYLRSDGRQIPECDPMTESRRAPV